MSNSSRSNQPLKDHFDEPVAIVGMACRFPSAPDLSEFWRLLEAGGNAVSEIEPTAGVARARMLFAQGAVRGEACRFGAFVDDIDRFDAQFFRISPVEAQLLDPQQRMMLETSWQALEDAGISAQRLAGTRTGVYVGISTDEYRMLVLDAVRPAKAAECLYALSGTNLNGAAGRVAFVLGVRGPVKAVDAACASSLVSVHDAVADLQRGNADLAIAGGVSAMLSGRVYELRADSMMLSPEGQCKAFDASADGYVRGEGCGVVVLKRLSEAEADGDRIWAVIRGSAVNHGGASVGLTVPNTPALEEVIAAALSRAGIAADEVDYLEAHGTGTAVGDPIEINAAAAAYCQGRAADTPLLIGSVKTNIGHLEAAAGVAGLIKAAMVVSFGVIPKHLHFRNPNPGLDWDDLPLEVATEKMPWPQRAGWPRRAGVNSFGISGTNAHILLEEHLARPESSGNGRWPVGCEQRVATSVQGNAETFQLPDRSVSHRPARLLPLSGKTDSALRELALEYASWLAERTREPSPTGDAVEQLLADAAWTASVGRSHFRIRAGIVFDGPDSLLTRLREVAETGGAARQPAAAKVAFAYTGQGSQWVGMGRDLYECEPVAAAVLDRCEVVFREQRRTSLLDVVFGRPGAAGRLDDTEWEQPALYALQCALTAMWASVGIVPDVVVGHSVGELAAAQAAGVFGLEDGMRLAEARGTLLAATAKGAMAAVFAPVDRVAGVVEELNAELAGATLSVSARNGLHQVVSGTVERVEAVTSRFESEGVRVRRLNTSRAFHSALVEPVLGTLEASLVNMVVKPPELPVISNLTGQLVEPDARLDGSYWKRHARQPVAFADGMQTMAEMGVDHVIEIGPRPILAPMVVSAWPESAEMPPRVLASLSPERPSLAPAPEKARGFVDAVAEAYEAGLEIDFEGLFSGELRRRIALPSYPFQRERYWFKAPKQRRRQTSHPLLGHRHESAAGDVSYETELFASDPAWLADHQVFGRILAPGALYASMAATAILSEGSGNVAGEGLQLVSPLLFPDEGAGEGAAESGRIVQVLLGSNGTPEGRPVRVCSKDRDGGWQTHLEGTVATDASISDAETRLDLNRLARELDSMDVAAYYRARLGTGIYLGPSFQTLVRIWAGPGEAVAEVAIPEDLDKEELDVHPLVLDGCFQVVGAARGLAGRDSAATYLPFGWERFWLLRRLPNRVFCHVRMQSTARETNQGNPPETQSGELRIYDSNGVLIGGIGGYTIKRATPAALLSAVEGVSDLLYEVQWRERMLPPGVEPAGFLPSPASVKARSNHFSEYLREAGVGYEDRLSLLADLERWSRSYALANLDRLGWQRKSGETVDAEALRRQLDVGADHGRLFRRMLEMLAKSGVLEETEQGFRVVLGSGDPWPEALPPDPEAFAGRMSERYSHGRTEIGLFSRSGTALADVLRGLADPLTLLFSSGEPTAADLYLRAPVARAANRMLGEAVRTLVAALPPTRRIRVVEVGAGTGSATASVLPELPEGRFEYVYTDISAGFFAEAEARFGDAGGCIEYRPLDIEKDPVSQGFDAHRYDLIIASNVLHATRYLEETLEHCRKLLAPSGQLVALENLHGQGWMDLTFGQLDGWWRFADAFRPHHALAGPPVWRQALGKTGFEEVEFLGVDESDLANIPDKGVIVARGPASVEEAPALWILAADRGEAAAHLAGQLAARNQTVVLAGRIWQQEGDPAGTAAGIRAVKVDPDRRESWLSLLNSLPRDVPFGGVVHMAALDGHGAQASVSEMADDVRVAGGSALALVQAVADSDLTPEKGVWLLTRGAQILERERGGELAGAVLWGFGKAVSREAPHLQTRMIDLDPTPAAPEPDLANALLYPDCEDHVAYRSGRRMVARLVRLAESDARLILPEDNEWVLSPDPGGAVDRPQVRPLPRQPLAAREVRVGVDAAGLNFWDVFRSLGFIEQGLLGREMCGRILESGSEVSSVSVGERVMGLGFGAFAPEMVTREELVVAVPEGYSMTGLATVPSAFVSAALSFELVGLEPGDRVLIHAGAGGVGLAGIQLVQAGGGEVFATASAPKQAYLRSLGVEHVFDSRTTDFGGEILAATGGTGVDVVLNSLTSEGFIESSLSCLKQGGRFVELARRDILSEDEMEALRPDVTYAILELDVLKKTEPAWVGRVLRALAERLAAGELRPITHSRWPLAEAGAALRFMRSARHIGKIVVTASPLAAGRLRTDRAYLITGGLGGIGCAMAIWLADHGARTIVLNGRRDPDAEAEETIRTLRQRGVNVCVQLADATDSAAMDRMMAHIGQELAPLAGVIHSVGVLSDGALTNQSWDRFETVLWPKILGAWHLHRATAELDLDFFVLFSSRVGVMGNPGQSNHAAANAFLDQLAGHRRAMGLPGMAIAWGAWSDIGEAAEQKDRIERRRAALGGRWFTPTQGLKAFERLLAQDLTQSVVMAMDWSVFEGASEERPAFLEDLLSEGLESEAASAESAGDVLTRLASAPASEHSPILVSFLQNEVQSVLRLPKAPEPSVGFFDLGMDSLMAVELRNRLNRALSGRYTASNTIVFDYPDINSLARHLCEEIGDDSEGAPPVVRAEVDAPTPLGSADDDAIAIVGMACRFPGAPNLAAFWRLLEAGTDAISDTCAESATRAEFSAGLSNGYGAYQRGGFVEDIDRFDARFFRVTPIEARGMDPRHRMLLETSWQALEDAGINPESLRGSRTGIYVGLAASEYRELMASGAAGTSYISTAPSTAVGRVAYHLGLEGPTLPLELNCASSLFAVHQAAVSLRLGEADLALVGGVQALLSAGVTREMAMLGMLSPEGRCKAFDASADGFVRAEGCGMVVLKRLGEAESDGDRIWGVIRGTAVNQNGASAGPTVPNGQAQERVIESALEQAGVSPLKVDYLEAHGAGSELGDSIEIQAADAIYGRGREAEKPLLIGSVKSNIGHLEPAAGVASLIKAVLSMCQGVVPKTLHYCSPNPHLDWERLSVRVVSELTTWPRHAERPPRAGVSAFGISGANAHVVVEGHSSQDALQFPPAGPGRVVASMPAESENVFVPATNGEREREARLLPLSAKTPQALRRLARRYHAWLEKELAILDESGLDHGATLANMAWTAGAGRAHFPSRAGLVFWDVRSLLAGLKATAEGISDGGADEQTLRQRRPSVAFVFPGRAADVPDAWRHLAESEPVMRAVLDRCDAAMAEVGGGFSVIDVILGRTGVLEESGAGPRWDLVVFALQSALAQLWKTVGVKPQAVVGYGVGELAAAAAAGMISLEDGLKILVAQAGQESVRRGQEALADSVAIPSKVKTPSCVVVSGFSGSTVEPETCLKQGNWLKSPDKPAAAGKCAKTLAELGVELLVEVLSPGVPNSHGLVAGGGAGLVPVISTLGDRSGEGFVDAVAAAYEQGLDICYEGLFAGETRSRIALPGYPFERRSFWFRPLEREMPLASE